MDVRLILNVIEEIMNDKENKVKELYSESLAKKLGKVSSVMSRMSNGDLAALRRMIPEKGIIPMAFWRLAAEAIPAVVELGVSAHPNGLVTRWATIVMWMAMIGDLRDIHVPLGRALSAACVLEPRVETLLRASAPSLYSHIRFIARSIVSKGQRVRDIDVANLVLVTDTMKQRNIRYRISGDYYMASR